MAKEIVFSLQRFANIRNEDDDTLVSGTSDNDTLYNSGDGVTM